MCTARGEGTLTFTWTTTAPVNLPSSVQTEFNPQDGSETSTLSLTNVGSNHSGVYACSVSNERGSTGLHQATLTIIGQLLNNYCKKLPSYIYFLCTPHTVIGRYQSVILM